MNINDNVYHDFNLTNWDKLKERYSNYIDDHIIGQKLIIFKYDSDEANWIEGQISQDLKNYTGKDHRIKIAVLGGLCAGNTLREHIDGHYPPSPDSCIWSLNIPIKNYESFEMLWYDGDYFHKEREDVPNLESMFQADEMQHLRPEWFGKKYLKDSVFIRSPTIVKINIPHQVINHGDMTRLLLAVRFTPDIEIR